MSIPADLTAYLDAWKTYILQQARENLAAAGAEVAKRLQETWPDVGKVHPYATGRSKGAIRRHAVSEDEQQVEVAVPYSGYTEEGYTRRGPKTARSWAVRGKKAGYGADVVEELRSELEELMRRGYGG